MTDYAPGTTSTSGISGSPDVLAPAKANELASRESSPDSTGAGLAAVQVNDPARALGVAVSYLIVGFAGWAFTTREKADAWIAGASDPLFEDSKSGEIIVINAWDEMRKVGGAKEAVYYKRFYNDGRLRPVRLPVNEFVATHVAQGETMNRNFLSDALATRFGGTPSGVRAQCDCAQ
jgi:hypothetical protein